MPSPNTRVMTAHLPAALATKVDSIAERLDRSRGWVVKQALSAWVEQEEDRQRLTLAALADVDLGHAVEHSEVEAWAQSLSTANPKSVPTCP